MHVPLAITLGLSTLFPALPAASVTPGSAVAVFFAPEEDCTAFAIGAI
jgi:hypothetical protein